MTRRKTAMKKHDRVYASVDLGAIADNFKNIGCNLTEGTKMIAIVKADAYGHGAVPVSRAIEHEERLWGFAVSTTEEAEELLDGGIAKPVLILGHAFPEDYETLVERNIRPTVSSLAAAAALSHTAALAGRLLPVHLAIDTGMSRIGLRGPRESLAEIKAISGLPNLRLEGIFTHFARADEEELEPTVRQLELFHSFLRLVEEAGIKIPMRHCNNSAGALWNRQGDMEAVRPGIALYGIYPSDETLNPGVALRPAMEIKSHLSRKGCGGRRFCQLRRHIRHHAGEYPHRHSSRRLRRRLSAQPVQQRQRVDPRPPGKDRRAYLHGPVYGRRYGDSRRQPGRRGDAAGKGRRRIYPRRGTFGAFGQISLRIFMLCRQTRPQSLPRLKLNITF